MIDEKKLIDEIASCFKYWENKAIFYETAGNAVDMKFCDDKAMELKGFITLIKNQPKVGEWIPCSERTPDDLVPVNITWVNRKPESYYADIKNKPFTATAVMYKGDWYWWSVDVEDMLTEYGESEHDKVAECIEITAWQPLPEPWKGENI